MNNTHKFENEYCLVTEKIYHGIRFLSKIVFKIYIINTNKSIKISLLYETLVHLIWGTRLIHMEHIAHQSK